MKKLITAEVEDYDATIVGDSAFFGESGSSGVVVGVNAYPESNNDREIIREWELWSETAKAHLKGAIKVAINHGATVDEVIDGMLNESNRRL